MNESTGMKGIFRLLAIAALPALTASPLIAADYYLAAKPFVKSLHVSGGIQVNVPMWGYVADTGGGVVAHCYNIAGADAAARQARLDCVNALADPGLPGPRLALPPGDAQLRVFLTNGLPEPTSVFIPGQELPYSGAVPGPTWSGGAIGARTSANQRMRSYGREASANGGRAQYVWSAAQGNALQRYGTFIYHSGTWPQKQVYMGLYGAMTRDAADAEIYPGVSYANEVLLFYSDIDPAHNKSVWCATQGTPTCLWEGVETVRRYTTSIDYRAQWFLVNGEPYVQGETQPIPGGAPGANVLVRLASAASETHVPTLQGLYLKIHAEDGFRYTWQNGAVFGGFSPREQYSAELPALKAKDAILIAPDLGSYAVYDGNGYMTNPSDPNDFTVGDTTGGMLRLLAFSVTGDADGDGVDDASDRCPGTASGVPAGANGCPAPIYFSTFGNAAVGALTNPDNADIYNWNGTAAGRTWDATSFGLPGGANIDSLHVVDADTFYLSFASDLSLPGIGTVENEDVVLYDAGVWRQYFDGTARGLTAAGHDIDAISVDGGGLFFSTLGNAAVPGVGGVPDNADVYRWDGSAFSRVLDASAVGVPGPANLDGLSVTGTVYYLSFATDVTLPGIGLVQDEDVVTYDGTSWSLRLDGAAIGLDANGNLDIDALHVP